MDLHVQIDGVTKAFPSARGNLLALERVTLGVGRGEFVSLLGPSGCGKTTLLRIVGGLLQPTTGRVTIDGRAPAEARREKAMGFVFQEPSLLPWRTVTDNIRLPLQVNRGVRRNTAPPVESLISMVGLDGFADAHPHQLSRGMRQRVALARALAFDPSLLLMDEPFGALDEITRAAMRFELLRLWEADRKTVVFVTHSVTEAITLSDRVVVLSDRPGCVRGIVDIDLPRPRPERVERGVEFLRYANLLRDLLTPGGRDEVPALE